jgi:hypothetical protein
MDTEHSEVALDILTQIDSQKVEAFAGLLRELISLVGASKLATLKRVMIVEGTQVANTVNSIMREVAPSMSYVPSHLYSAEAVSVPVESADSLVCHIVMSETFLNTFTSEHSHPADTVSTLLEELLHIWVYSSTWQRRGYVQHWNRDLESCEVDVLTIASSMCDEYVVIRMKSQLLATLPLIEFEPNVGFAGAKLLYGGDVVDEITRGSSELRKIVTEAARGVRAVPEAWSDVVTTLYRGVFEPLSRKAAYCDGANGEPFPEDRLRSVRFYHELLAGCWYEIHEHLKRVFDSDLRETENGLDGISSRIRALLRKIGVTYRKIDGNQCWVDFKSGFFDW